MAARDEAQHYDTRDRSRKLTRAQLHALRSQRLVMALEREQRDRREPRNCADWEERELEGKELGIVDQTQNGSAVHVSG